MNRRVFNSLVSRLAVSVPLLGSSLVGSAQRTVAPAVNVATQTITVAVTRGKDLYYLADESGIMLAPNRVVQVVGQFSQGGHVTDLLAEQYTVGDGYIRLSDVLVQWLDRVVVVFAS